jgi:hypothetical protein
VTREPAPIEDGGSFVTRNVVPIDHEGVPIDHDSSSVIPRRVSIKLGAFFPRDLVDRPRRV